MAPKYTLKYFDARGRAEVLRWIFVVAGEEFEDVRYSFEDWPKHKNEMPFKQVPVLEIDGAPFPISQCLAIGHYLGKQFNMVGSTPEEEAKAAMIAGCLNDMRAPFRNIVMETDAKRKEERRVAYNDEELPNCMSAFEELLKSNNGGDDYFIGDKLSWADLMFVSFMEEDLYENIVKVKLNLEHYPKCFALCQRVRNIPSLAKWLEARPQTER